MKLIGGFYRNLLDNLYDGVYFVDKDRKILYWNEGAVHLTGYSSAEVVGMPCGRNILAHVSEKGVLMCRGVCPLARTIKDGKTREVNAYLHHKDGHRVPVLIKATPVRNRSGRITGAVEIFSDNTLRADFIGQIEALRKIALVDTLTGIGNRRFAQAGLDASFSEAKRYGWRFGVLFIDIDHFKKINDIFGHDMGDRILVMVARTLSGNIRLFDTVARWGGEEFIVLLKNINRAQLLSAAEKLRILTGKSSFMIGKKRVGVTISVGAAMAGADDTARGIVKRADDLMYESKKSGRNRVTTEHGP